MTGGNIGEGNKMWGQGLPGKERLARIGLMLAYVLLLSESELYNETTAE